MNLRSLVSGDVLDKTGAAVSWACAAHCLLMPFAVSFLPLFGISFLAHEGFEYFFIGLSVSVAATSLLPAYFRQHRRIRTLMLFVSGIGFVIFADTLFPENLIGKMVLVLMGAGLITSSHFLNSRLCRECRNCGESHHRSLA